MKFGRGVVKRRLALSLNSYSDELCEGVVDVSSAWQEEAAARAEIMEEEQLLILWSTADQQRYFLITSQILINSRYDQ